MLRSPLALALSVMAVMALTALLLRLPARPVATTPAFLEARPEGVMGTTCRMLADGSQAREALAAAEVELRTCEAQVSAWLDASDLGRVNAAAAGVLVPVGERFQAVYDLAQRAAPVSDGAFDATILPLLRLWLEGRRQGREPDAAAIAQARAASTWEHFRREGGAVVKSVGSAALDFGGVAKGWAVDRAVAALRAQGVANGQVEVGGDLVCFGSPRPGQDLPWPVLVASPTGEGVCAVLALRDRAVCTSGNYRRSTEIAGRRYSHIIDPRSGRPADALPSVTVVAPTCAEADVWATALSVLGPVGLAKLPPGVEALLIGGTEAGSPTYQTPGFAALVRAGPTLPRLPEGAW